MGGYRNMDDQGYQILMDFRKPPSVFLHYTLKEALLEQIPAEAVYDKIVLIGTAAESSKDFFSIPTLAAFDKIPGVAMHGMVIDQLIRVAYSGKHPLRFFPEWLEWLWVGLCCIAGAFIGSRKYPLRFFVPLQLLGLAVDGSIVFILFQSGIWIPLVPSACAWLSSAILVTSWAAHQENRQRSLLMNLFARHVSSQIADEIWQHRGDIVMNGRISPQRMTATVFFSDLADFTRIAESLEPEIFINWLNDYLDAMTSIINQYNGVVIRFIGDAIMAVFGVPIPRAQASAIALDAVRAVRCALAIQNTLIKLNQSWLQQGLPTVTMRIGINTGFLLAGSLGNRERLEYTIHGDTVNTASRLENYEKDKIVADYLVAPCRILISAATEHYLTSDIPRYSLGNIALKGKHTNIEIFCLSVNSRERNIE
jgi:adenylate cyclase